MTITFADFKKRCFTVCEVLKTIEYLEPNESKKAYFEDAYFILDFLISEEYADIDYTFDYSIVRKIMFHDLPKHRSNDKYFEDFIKAYMPKYDYSELKKRYTHFVGSFDAIQGRVNALDYIVRCYLEQAFIMVGNL